MAGSALFFELELTIFTRQRWPSDIVQLYNILSWLSGLLTAHPHKERVFSVT